MHRVNGKSKSDIRSILLIQLKKLVSSGHQIGGIILINRVVNEQRRSYILGINPQISASSAEYRWLLPALLI